MKIQRSISEKSVVPRDFNCRHWFPFCIYCLHEGWGFVIPAQKTRLAHQSLFRRASLVLAYAIPEKALRPLLPPGLQLDTYGEFGFLAIAMVEARDLRPAFSPAGLGLDFFLAGYRIFTRYRTLGGRTLRGLRILRSDTDRRSMRVFGNLLTHYGYELSRCNIHRTECTYTVEICTPNGDADLEVEADISGDAISPPPGSPFPDVREARKFAGPLPFTFDYERETHSIIRVEGGGVNR